ncbi:hypothetical protein L7F22_003147 [Adiantum nelumboides]|nr:hypothetical protein [Adiantum nelumboides]
MLATSKVWLDRGGSSLNNHLSTIDHQKEEGGEEGIANVVAVAAAAAASASDFAGLSTRQSTIMNAWNRDYPTGAPRSDGQSAGLESGQSALSAQHTSPFAVTQNAWSASPEQQTYTSLPSINAPGHPGGGAPPYGHPTSFENNEPTLGSSMNYGSGGGGGSSEYAMLARPHSSGGNQSGGFQMMANRPYLNPPSSTFGHSTGLSTPAPGVHPSPNQAMGHAPTFSDSLSGGHYTFGSGGASTASGLASANPNLESPYNHPSMQSGDHERESYVYSNVQGHHPSSSTSVPSHHHHHHFGGGGGSTYSMLGGVPIGQSGSHYFSSTGQYEGYPAFYNPFEVKHRRRTTRSQFKVLESTFLETPKPTASTRKALAEQLDMPLRAIQIWFQNRRAKAKSQSHRSSTSHSLPGGSSGSNNGRFGDSPPSITSQRAGSGSAGVGRPSTSSSSSSYYHGSKSAITASGPGGDSKPPLSSSSLSSTGSGQVGSGSPFEESKRYTYPHSGVGKPVHLSRLDLPPLTSGEPSSVQLLSLHLQILLLILSKYLLYSPNLPTNPSGGSQASSASQSTVNDIADEQNRRPHQSSSWR